MNDIISLELLAERLAKRTGLTTDQARQYITIVQRYVTERLTAGDDEATVPYLGTFRVEKWTSGAVTFDPIPEIAETVNEPFSFFESVTLEDDTELDATTENENTNNATGEDVTETTVESDEITQATPVEVVQHDDTSVESTDIVDNMTAIDNNENDTDKIVSASNIESNPEIEQEQETKTEPVLETEQEQEHELEIETVLETSQENDNNTVQNYETEPAHEYPEDDSDEESRHSMNPIVAYILGILTGMVITCIAVYFLYPPLYSGDDELIIDETEIVSPDNVGNSTPDVEPSTLPADITGAEQPTTAEPQPIAKTQQPVATPAQKPQQTQSTVTDTVGPKYYLATMSRKYYGRMEFWVYIYKENQGKLGHPDRIPVGTVVTIPPASKYGIDANSQASIDKAREEASALLSRFK